MEVSLSVWIIGHSISALIYAWIIFWGGARWLEGWKAWGILGWFAGHWNADQLRLYAACILFLDIIWFVVGLVYPGARFF